MADSFAVASPRKAKKGLAYSAWSLAQMAA
jgi:hypothetical protein